MRAILSFHGIDASGSVLSFDAPLFDALLANLTRKAVLICDLDSLLADSGKDGIAITFDDGLKSVYQNALPILQWYQVPAHLFLSTGAIGARRLWPHCPANDASVEMLDWSEVEALHHAGIRIECHTHSHLDMRELTGDQIAEECGTADDVISSRLGRKPGYFAYPFGYHNQKVRDCVRERYTACVTTELRTLGSDEDSAALPRLDTYYLRSRAGIRFIDTSLMQVYLALRSKLRTLRGRQCLAGHC